MAVDDVDAAFADMFGEVEYRCCAPLQYACASSALNMLTGQSMGMPPACATPQGSHCEDTAQTEALPPTSSPRATAVMPQQPPSPTAAGKDHHVIASGEAAKLVSQQC